MTAVPKIDDAPRISASTPLRRIVGYGCDLVATEPEELIIPASFSPKCIMISSRSQRTSSSSGNRHLDIIPVILSASFGSGSPDAEILRCAQDDRQDSTPVRSQEDFSPNICSGNRLLDGYTTHGIYSTVDDINVIEKGGAALSEYCD